MDRPDPIDKISTPGAAYELRMGRWSRLVATGFLDWLAPAHGLRWLDVGCGTGALCEIILEKYHPSRVAGVDFSPSQLAFARTPLPREHVHFLRADAQALPFANRSFDVAVSGLALNFFPDKAQALQEIIRVLRPAGRVACYVWDFAGEMQMMRRFWDAAASFRPAAREFDQATRFPDCKPQPLANLFRSAGLQEVQTRAIDVPMIFKNFDDYWNPMTIGDGTIPEYLLSLSEDDRASLKNHLRQSLQPRPDGAIPLIARAWAVAGTVSAL